MSLRARHDAHSCARQNVKMLKLLFWQVMSMFQTIWISNTFILNFHPFNMINFWSNNMASRARQTQKYMRA